MKVRVWGNHPTIGDFDETIEVHGTLADSQLIICIVDATDKLLRLPPLLINPPEDGAERAQRSGYQKFCYDYDAHGETAPRSLI